MRHYNHPLPISALTDVAKFANAGSMLLLASCSGHLEDADLFEASLRMAQSNIFISTSLGEELATSGNFRPLLHSWGKLTPDCVNLIMERTDLLDFGTAWLLPNEWLNLADDWPIRFDSLIYGYSRGDDFFQLTETYRFKRYPRQTQLIGQWSEEDGLLVDIPCAWNRRTSLQGAVLRDSTIRWLPYSLLDEEDGQATGLMGDTLRALSSLLNFTTVTTGPVDNTWGVKGEDGRHNGIVGQLQAGEVDVSSSGLTMLASRLNVMDHTVPVFREKVTVGVAVETLDQEGQRAWNPKPFLAIYTNKTWVGILLTILIVSVLADFLPYFKHQTIPMGLGATLAAVARGTLPSSFKLDMVSARALALTSAMFSFVVVTIYSCDITAKMTIRKQMIINSFQV